MHSASGALGKATAGADASPVSTRSKNVNKDSNVTDQALPRFSTYSLTTANVRVPASELSWSMPTGSGTLGRGDALAKKRPTSSSTFGPSSTLRKSLRSHDEPYKIVELLCSSAKKRGSSEPVAGFGLEKELAAESTVFTRQYSAIAKNPEHRIGKDARRARVEQ